MPVDFTAEKSVGRYFCIAADISVREAEKSIAQWKDRGADIRCTQRWHAYVASVMANAPGYCDVINLGNLDKAVYVARMAYELGRWNPRNGGDVGAERRAQLLDHGRLPLEWRNAMNMSPEEVKHRLTYPIVDGRLAPPKVQVGGVEADLVEGDAAVDNTGVRKPCPTCKYLTCQCEPKAESRAQAQPTQRASDCRTIETEKPAVPDGSAQDFLRIREAFASHCSASPVDPAAMTNVLAVWGEHNMRMAPAGQGSALLRVDPEMGRRLWWEWVAAVVLDQRYANLGAFAGHLPLFGRVCDGLYEAGSYALDEESVAAALEGRLVEDWAAVEWSGETWARALTSDPAPSTTEPVTIDLMQALKDSLGSVLKARLGDQAETVSYHLSVPPNVEEALKKHAPDADDPVPPTGIVITRRALEGLRGVYVPGSEEDEAIGEALATLGLDKGTDHWTRDAADGVLHVSHLGTLQRCPMQYRYRYLEGLVQPPGVSLIQGTACHTSVEVNLRTKMERGDLLADEEVAAVTSDAHDKRVEEEGVTLTEDDAGEPVGAVLGASKDRAISMALAHHREIAPKLLPVHVERHWRIKVGGVSLAGTMDEQEPNRVYDWKFTVKAKRQADADDSLQLSMYALATRVLDGVVPDVFTIGNVAKGKTDPRVHLFDTTRGDQDMKNAIRHARAAQATIKAGAFMPADPTSWACSARFCGYFDAVCPYGRRGRSRPGVVK